MTQSSTSERTRPAQRRLMEAFVRHGGVMTRQMIAGEGHTTRSLAQLLEQGLITRSTRAVYRLTELLPVGETAFAEAMLSVPGSIVCLISALSYYGLTTQIPAAVYVAVPRQLATRRNDGDVLLITVRMPGFLLRDGVERVRTSDDQRFRIFTAERSVCDAFRFVGLVGEDVAYESLRRYLDLSNPNINKLIEAAKVTGVYKTIESALQTYMAIS
jgi:predicted transcriptional regulator of viral defense system